MDASLKPATSGVVQALLEVDYFCQAHNQIHFVRVSEIADGRT